MSIILPAPLPIRDYIVWILKNEPDRICTQADRQRWLAEVAKFKERKKK